MKKIPSFTIDHNQLLPGIYVSRKAPNREPALHPGALHTIEHLAATYLRNNEEWQDRIVYWGPMGCLTGNYLLMKGDMKSEEIVKLMIDTFEFVANYDGVVPGTEPQDCGNYLLHDLPMARYEAKQYLKVLKNIKPENLNYPEKAE